MVLSRLNDAAKELAMFTIIFALLSHAHNQKSAQATTDAVNNLPGQGSYGYHIVRSWQTVARHLRGTQLVPFPKLKPQEEECCASEMSGHVKLIYSIIGNSWQSVVYPKTFEDHDVIKGRSLSHGDRAEVACELQRFCYSFNIAPPQKDSSKFGDARTFVNVQLAIIIPQNVISIKNLTCILFQKFLKEVLRLATTIS